MAKKSNLPKRRSNLLNKEKKRFYHQSLPQKTKKQKIQSILIQAQKRGMKPEEIAERLNITIED